MNATLRSSAQRTPLARATGMHAARTSMRTARPAPFITGKKAAAPAPQTSVKALDTEILMLSEGLETPVELFYVLSLVALLITAGFFVIRQVLIRRSATRDPTQIYVLYVYFTSCCIVSPCVGGTKDKDGRKFFIFLDLLPILNSRHPGSSMSLPRSWERRFAWALLRRKTISSWAPSWSARNSTPRHVEMLTILSALLVASFDRSPIAVGDVDRRVSIMT